MRQELSMNFGFVNWLSRHPELKPDGSMEMVHHICNLEYLGMVMYPPDRIDPFISSAIS